MGSPQVINCTVSTVSGVDLNSVMIMWLDSEDNVIVGDGRVIISDITSIGNNSFSSSLNFSYLMEGDSGDVDTYTCDVMILDASGTDSIVIESLIGQYIQMFKVIYTEICTIWCTTLVVENFGGLLPINILADKINILPFC